jgi:hypothetical protein
MNFPRFLSGLIEIDDAWLRSPVISGYLRPFGTVSVGSPEQPFEAAYVNELSNRFGQMKINDAISGSVIDLTIDEGTLKPALRYNDSLTIIDGKLAVKERILLPSNIQFSYDPPLFFQLDEEDRVGGKVWLKYDEDDFAVEGGKLDLKETSYKGFGGISVGGLSDVDFIDEVISDEDLNLPKLKGIRLSTSDDLTQVTGKLAVRPKGLGQIPYYTLSGLGADESLYWNSVANTLSVPRVLMQTRFVLSPNEATTQAYVAQFIQALPGGGIDVLPEVQGTGRREIRVRVDPSGCIMNDPSMGGALDVRCDGVTLVKKAGILSANYMGDEDGDLVVSGNMIRSIMTFNAPLVKTGNVVSLNLIAEAPDLTYAAGTLTCNIDAGVGLLKTGPILSLNLIAETPDLTLVGNTLVCNISAGTGLIKAGPVLSLAPEKLRQLDDATQDITDTKESLENVNDKLTETTQKVNDAVDDITDVKSGLEGVNDTANAARTAADAAANTASQAAKTAGDLANKIGDLSSVVDGIGDLSKTIGISVGTSMLTSAVTTSISAAALGLAAQSQAQNIISNGVSKAIGVGAAFAGLFGAIGGAIGGALGKKGNQNTYISYNSYSGGGIAEKQSDDEQDSYYYGWSLCNPTEYDASLYPDRATAVAGFTPLLGSGLLPVESTNARTGQLICVGGFGASGNVHAGKDVYANGKRLATEDFLSAQLVPYATQSWVTGKGYITASALTPYLLASTASSTYLTIANASTTYQKSITVGAGLSLTGNSISLIGDAVLSSVDVASGMLSVKKTPWSEPTMTANSQNGYLVSCSSSFASNYDAWYAFNKAGGSWYSSDGRYSSTAPYPYTGSNVTVANGVSYPGEWLQFRGIVSVYLTSYTLDASSVATTPVSFVLLGSKDGTTWTLLDTQTDLIWSGTSRRTFNISVSTSYTYFRIVCQRSLTTYVGFGEFKMNGYVEEVKCKSETFTWNDQQIATQAYVTGQGYITSAALSSYSTTSQMNSAITTALSPYSTTTQVSSAISTALSSYSTTTQMNSAISTALSPYSTTTQMNSAISTTLSSYSTTTQMNSAISTALSPYSTTAQMNSVLGSYVTVTTLSAYLLSTTAASIYQPLITAGGNILKSGNTLSVNPDPTFDTLNVCNGALQLWKPVLSQPSMGSYTGNLNAGNKGVIVSDSSSTVGFEGWRVFDTRDATFRWVSQAKYVSGTSPTKTAGNSGEWLQVYIPKISYLTSYSLQFYSTDLGKSFKSWVLLGSTDGTTWSVIDTRTNIVWTSAAQSFTPPTVNLNTRYNYHRIVATALQDPAETSASLYRWNFVGYHEEVVVRAAKFQLNGLDVVTSADIYSKSYLDTNFALKTYVDTQIGTRQASGDYATTTALNNGLATKANTADVYSKSYLDTNFALKTYVDTQIGTRQASGDYATTTALNNGLSTRAPVFSVSTPLTYASNTIGLDTSTLCTKTQADSTFQKKLVVGQNLVSDGINISTSLDPVFNTVTTGGIAIRKVFVSPTNMTSTTLGGFTVNQSSRYSTIYSGYNMFSSSTVNGWRSGQYYNNPYNGFSSTATTNVGTLTGDYVLIQCPLPTILSSFTLTPHPSYLPNMPNSFALVGSTDGTTWVSLGTFAETVSAQKTFAVSTQGAKYTYFRFVVMALGSGTYAVVQKMRLDGVTEEPGDLSVGFGLTKTVGVLAVDSTQVQNKVGLVAPLQWTGSGNTLQLDQSAIGQVGTLLQTNITSSGQLFTDTVGKMTALRLSASSNSFDGVALSLDATWLAGAARNWTMHSLADGNLTLNSNGARKVWFKDSGSMTLAESMDPSIYLSGNGGAGFSCGLLLNPWGGRAGGWGCQLLAVDAGNADTYFSLRVATGDTNTQSSEVIRSTTQKTNVYNQLHIQNTSIATGSFGVPFTVNANTSAFTVEGSSVFNGTVLINPVRTTTSPVSAWRYMLGRSDSSWNGWSASSSAQVSVFMGATRFLIASGGEINIVSQRSTKQAIKPIQNALDAVNRIPACSYQYKAVPDRDTMGFIAEEVAEVFPQLVDTAISPENETCLILNQMPLIAVLWRAVQELAREVQELKKAGRG